MNTPTSPVGDTVPQVDNELAVGEDLEFQRRWWRFERIVWRVFAVLVLLDLLGLFGRGPLANAHMHSPDGLLSMNYERVERFSTPSILKIRFGPEAVHNGEVQLWVSSSVVDRLGNQRVIPSPLRSTVSDRGILYDFPAETAASSIAFALQPATVGSARFTVRLLRDGSKPPEVLSARVFVMP